MKHPVLTGKQKIIDFIQIRHRSRAGGPLIRQQGAETRGAEDESKAGNATHTVIGALVDGFFIWLGIASEPAIVDSVEPNLSENPRLTQVWT